MKIRSKKKGLEIGLDNEYPDPIFVHADAERIYRVLINLISNAIKYTHKGRIDLGFEVKGNEVRVFVRDTGVGIPTEDLDRIFERFFRVDKSRSKDSGGTGLGLAIVKHILEAHDTHVGVVSTVNKGSVFSFKLPIGQSTEEMEEEANQELELLEVKDA